MEDKDIIHIQEGEEEKPSLIKKILIILIGIFLLILILSYFLISPSNLQKITGYLQSNILQGSTVKVDHNTNLIFNNISKMEKEFKQALEKQQKGLENLKVAEERYEELYEKYSEKACLAQCFKDSVPEHA